MLVLTSVVPASAAGGLSTLPRTQNPDVVSYDVVSAAPATQAPRVVEGLAASLTTATNTLRVNQPAIFTATIANVGSSLRLLWSPYCTYVFSVTNSSTNLSKNVRPLKCVDDIYSPPIERLSPGTAAVLTFKFADPALAGLPGRYTVDLRSIMWYPTAASKIESLPITSNSIAVVVTR
jgi:hypothetical protein